MRPDGTIIEPPKPSLGMILLRVAAFGVFLCLAAVLFWSLIMLLPLLILLGVIGFFALRAQLRRGGTTVFTYRR